MDTRAVIFDLGNTLVRLCPPEVVFQRILHSMNIEKSNIEIRQALTETQSQLKSRFLSTYGKIPCKEYWGHWDSLVLKRLGISNYESISKEIHLRWFDNADCQSYSDTRTTLLELKEMGLREALVSTGYEEDISAILAKAGIQKEFFQVIVGADTIKRVKPDPAVFIFALQRLNVKPKEVLFVGDKIDEDYQRVRELGIISLLLQRVRRKNHQDPSIQTIHALTEIPVIIARGLIR